MDRVTAAPGLVLTAYIVAFSLFALWFYSLMQPRYAPNLGMAAYQAPPGTVISYELPARLLPWEGPLPVAVEPEKRAEEPRTVERPVKAVASEPERIIDVRKPKPPKPAATTPKVPGPTRERDSPLADYAAAYPGYSGDRAY